MKKYFLFALLAMFIVGCDSPNVYYPSGGDSDDGGSNNKSYIVTGEATDLTYKSVTLSGKVNMEIADYETIEWGMMYSADKAELESHLGSMVLAEGALQEDMYSVSVTGLESETQYYYCAFVFLNEKQYKYGSVKNFTTLEAPKIDGIGIFSVSADKQVTFSKGNLQYHPANNEWRFAMDQTYCIGYANSNISSTYNGWLDLFGWSTSANNFGVSTSIDYSDYSGSFVDWGVNKIGNDAPNTWRTLTYDEWDYLLWERPNYSMLCGVAEVNGVNGLILLPDNCICPSGVTFKSGFHSSYSVDYYAAYQTFTADQWSKLESAGAVFLPASGSRYGSTVYDVQYDGDYWSSTLGDSDGAWGLYLNPGEAYVGYDYRIFGQSVRLVKNL